MGHKEGEVIQHSMITKSIERAHESSLPMYGPPAIERINGCKMPLIYLFSRHKPDRVLYPSSSACIITSVSNSIDPSNTSAP